MTAVALIIGLAVLLVNFVVFFGAPYVPSRRRDVEHAFTELRPLTKRDTLLDLGSGDGAVMKLAIKHGAGRAIGWELNPLLVWVGWMRLRQYRAQTSVRLANMWHALLPPEVTVLYVFGVGRDMAKLERRVQRWANERGGSIDLVLYAHELPTLKKQRVSGAHNLYVIVPTSTGD